MPKQTFQATKSLIEQPTVQLFQTNPTIQYSDNSFNVKPTKMLNDCVGRGLRPDPPAPTGVNLLPADYLKKTLIIKISGKSKSMTHSSFCKPEVILLARKEEQVKLRSKVQCVKSSM